MNQEQLLQLLGSLRSSDNGVRNAAEAQYEQLLQTQAAWMMHALAEVCATSADASVVTISLILLRKLLNRDPSPFDAADAATQAAIKARMLQVLETAAYGVQRGSAAACVSALAVKVYQTRQDWSELWENIFGLISAPQSANELRTVCCEIIGTTAGTMADYFKAHIDTVTTGLGNCLKADGDAKALKHAAFEAIMHLAPFGFIDKLAPLVPMMLEVIQERLTAQDWDTAESLMDVIATAISQTPQLFENHTVPLLSGMMMVASTPAVDKGARHMAIETLLSYCESQPKTVRRIPQFATSFFELLFQYTLNPTYEDNWDISDPKPDEEELEEDSDQVIGSGGLDRLAVALGGRKLQSTAQSLFEQNIHGTDWKQRNAALLLICYVAEGMSTVFESNLEAIVKSVNAAVTDEVKYVRASALNCLSQLCQDFAPDLQINLHGHFLPAVIATLRDPVPHVAASAAGCLDNFFDNVIEEDESNESVGKMFQPFVQRVCEDCVVLLRSTPHIFVRESALGALSSLISTCKELLAPYTTALVPVFQEVLATPDSAKVMDMKCKALECVTLLACGVGKEVFAPYAVQVCEYLGSLSAQTGRNDDVRTRFVLRGWTCMVECLKQDVLPYMVHVMPMLIRMMNLECDAIIVNADVGGDKDEDKAEAEKGIETCRFVIPGVGEKVAKFHSGLIEDKELASNVVNAMLQELGMGLVPYFHDIVTSALSLLTFRVNPSIRENGALILNEILEACSQGQITAESQQLAMTALAPLLNALEEESEADVMETLMQVISRCVNMYPGAVNNTNVKMVGDKLLATLKVMEENRRECMAKIKAEHDEDEIDNLDSEKEELENSIESACDLIGTLLERASDTFAPLFIVNFFPIISAWLQSHEDDFAVARAVVILCDFVEHAPRFVTDSLPLICTTVLSLASTRTDEDLLQSSFYLINLLAQFLGNHPEVSNVNAADFVQHAQQILQHFFASSVAKQKKYASCVCNAVSAYVSLLQFFGASALQAVAASMMETVLAHLPATADEIEAARIHDRVLAWVVHQSPLLQLVPNARANLLQRLKSADVENLSQSAQQQLAVL